ncbi:glycoside hydrolase 43 family protein [Sphaerisporangium melleum]|uniref:Glycoside hydrolase 43 family protein n=1 Tax=Sphaerisporangium melleum TaxID=321316 RepID=A0A917RPZ6_9ACTN|nr:glycoside hydrolase family 43 protein [Sphaerisporangium melleum]GGL18312.1 glycoside hydrolase 43 family protein [Sphaerisporangium melleum]GII74758.1 glycoside hydrolase 43 family protein [Sphaerisporangium melleum]
MRTYRNPVLPGFHPDPSVCRVGEDYYLVCSSFEYFPGVPIFHSRDLVHWRQIGNVLDRPSQLRLPPEALASRGIYAPTIRHHDGLFYVITTNMSGDERRNFLVTAERPEGPWSDPVWIDLPGVDPDLAWEQDGTCWCSTSGTRLSRIDPATGEVLEGPVRMWSGTGGRYPEAPHFYRIGEWWYLLLSEGGTERAHAISVARARSPRGPYEPAPGNPILTHRGTDRRIQSTGHADLVSAPDGTWWMIMLAVRARGFSPEFQVLGRETFLAPVTWEDGWPVVGPVEDEHPAPAAWHPLPPPPVRDDFDGPVLAPGWISLRDRPEGAWSLSERPGRLTLHATGPTLDRPGHTFVGRRQQHHDCRFSARLDPGAARAGLTLRLDEAHHYDIEVYQGEASAIARIGPLRQVVARCPVPPGPLTLFIDVRTTGILPPTVTAAGQVDAGPLGVGPHGPDTVSLGVETGERVVLAELDGRYLSTEVATGFTGRVAGMYVTEGDAAFDWFDYEGRDGAAEA